MSTEAEVVQRLFLSLETRVTCPKCASKFSLQQGFAKEGLDRLEEATEGVLEAVREAERAEALKYAQQVASQRDKTLRSENAQLQQLLKDQAEGHSKAMKEVRILTEKAMSAQVATLRTQLADSQSRLDELAQREAALAVREQSIEARIQQEAKAKAHDLFAADRQSLEQQLEQKTRQISDLRGAEIALRQEKAALEDRAQALEVEVARKLDAGRAELEARIRTQERERADLEKADLQKRLDDVNTQLVEAQRKGSQGSQQLQGEVLELTLESALERAFPLDTVEEVKKGARGGDVVHRITTRSGQVAGILLWEAKRAKDWSPQWATKLKEDMRSCGADIGVLVITGTALPKDWDPSQLFGLHEDVWVTSWTTAVQLATVLRSGVLDLHKQRLVSAGKGEKMEAVYDYLTSSQFAHKLKAIHAAFYRMRQELESEKSQTLQRWARREKQLQSGIAELVGVAGDIQGLAQQDLPLLEMEDGGPDGEAAAPAADGPTPQLGLKIDERSR
ncbi:MAG TPA: DUF2130 domain-containing protein [Steroidobacteraceae bacterium]|nr:DUF2130 domain-containing protein [Steroidobacteraceae bacterium]